MAMYWPNRHLVSVMLLLNFCLCFPNIYHTMDIYQTSKILMQFINTSYTHQTDHSAETINNNVLALIWGLILSVFVLGNLAGTFAMPALLEHLGRRRVIIYILPCVLMLGTSIFEASSLTGIWELLPVGRFVTGSSAGIALQVTGIYATECSPNQFRSVVYSLTSFAVSLALFFTSLFGLPDVMGNHRLSHLYFALPIPLVVILMLMASSLPESPMYLLIRQGDIQGARETARRFHGSQYDEQQLLADAVVEATQSSESVGWLEIWRTRHLRRAVQLGVATRLAITCSGVFTVAVTSGILLQQASFGLFAGAKYATAAVYGIGPIFALASLLLSAKCGRRKLFLVGLVLIQFGNILCTIFTAVHARYMATSADNNRMLLVGSMLSLAVNYWIFLLSVVPACLAYPSEFAPQNARAAVCQLTNCIVLVTELFFWILSSKLEELLQHWAILLLFVAPSCLLLPWLFRNLPETRNRSIAEIVKTIGGHKEEYSDTIPLSGSISTLSYGGIDEREPST